MAAVKSEQATALKVPEGGRWDVRAEDVARGLSDEERNIVMAAIERDNALRAIEKERISQLKSEMTNLRRRSVRKEGIDPMKTCSRCSTQFGVVLDKGDICGHCKQKVCNKCRSYGLSKEHWVCNFCFRQMQMEGMTGRWFYGKFPKSCLNPKTKEVITVSELLGKAILQTAVSRQTIDVTDNNNRKSTQYRPGSSRGISPLPGVVVSTDARSTGDGLSNSEVDETDNFPDMRSPYGLGVQKVGSRASLNLLSPFSGSRESVVSVYSNAGEENYGKIRVSGQVEFGLTFNTKKKCLDVHISRCSDLAAVDTKKNTSNPYVKTYLLPDKSRSGKRKTRIKKGTLDPVFDEVIQYSVSSPNELAIRSLCLMVWHSDTFGRNDFLGEVILPLDNPSVLLGEARKYQLQERKPLSPGVGGASLSYQGDVELVLKYLTAEQLSAKRKTVIVHGELELIVKCARNLACSDRSNTFCRAYMLPEKSSTIGRGGSLKGKQQQKSSIVKHSNNPQWNHTFSFPSVAMDELAERGLELTVWDHSSMKTNDFIGGIRLSTGSGMSDWMDSRPEETNLWNSMMNKPNSWVEATLTLRADMNRLVSQRDSLRR